MKQNETAKYSQKFLKRRKMLTVLPFLVVPFITIAFYALGGGKGGGEISKKLQANTGLNLQLPGSSLKDDGRANKLSFYEKAEEDSLKLREQIKMDPYYNLKELKNHAEDSLGEIENIVRTASSRYGQQKITDDKGLNSSPTNADGSNDPAADKIMKKIAQLNQVINQPQQLVKVDKSNGTDYTNSDHKEKFTLDVDRLQNMMESISKGSEEDPELKRMESVLDKLIDVQHPERLSEQLNEKSIKNKDKVYPVYKTESDATISLLNNNASDTNGKKDRSDVKSASGFFGIEEKETAPIDQTGIEAVMQETSTLTTGSTVKLRLLNDIVINGEFVPKDVFVYGTASLSDERLRVDIMTIRYNNSILPVKLSVYDLDGMEGIYIPGSISRDVAKQTAQNAVQGMDVLNLDPSLKAQATAAGIGAAKSLITRKAKLVKVMVKANYRVLLRDMNTQQ